MKSKTKKVFDRIAQKASFDRTFSSMRNKPGSYIEGLPTEDREALKDLKADDLKNGVPYLPATKRPKRKVPKSEHDKGNVW